MTDLKGCQATTHSIDHETVPSDGAISLSDRRPFCESVGTRRQRMGCQAPAGTAFANPGANAAVASPHMRGSFVACKQPAGAPAHNSDISHQSASAVALAHEAGPAKPLHQPRRARLDVSSPNSPSAVAASPEREAAGAFFGRGHAPVQIERFMGKVAIDPRAGRNACWIWKAALNQSALPVFAGGYSARTFAVEHFFRTRLSLCTRIVVTCGSSLCVNPLHLAAGGVVGRWSGHHA